MQSDSEPENKEVSKKVALMMKWYDMFQSYNVLCITATRVYIELLITDYRPF